MIICACNVYQGTCDFKTPPQKKNKKIKELNSKAESKAM